MIGHRRQQRTRRRHEQQLPDLPRPGLPRGHHWARTQVDHGADHARCRRRARHARSRGPRDHVPVARAVTAQAEAGAVAVGVAVEVRAQRLSISTSPGVHAAASEQVLSAACARETRARLPCRRMVHRLLARIEIPDAEVRAFSMACSQRRCSTVGFGMDGVPVFEGAPILGKRANSPIARSAPQSWCFRGPNRAHGAAPAPAAPQPPSTGPRHAHGDADPRAAAAASPASHAPAATPNGGHQLPAR